MCFPTCFPVLLGNRSGVAPATSDAKNQPFQQRLPSHAFNLLLLPGGQLQRDPLLPAPHGPHEHLGPGGVRQPGVRAADGGGTQGGRIAEFPLRPGGGGSVDH